MSCLVVVATALGRLEGSAGRELESGFCADPPSRNVVISDSDQFSGKGHRIRHDLVTLVKEMKIKLQMEVCICQNIELQLCRSFETM